MFSLRFAVLALCVFSISGQQYDNSKPSDNGEKGYAFGRLRLSEDGKQEELISGNSKDKTQLKQDQTQNVTPLPSPCAGSRPSTKLPYPGDKAKYIQCRDEFHYEIFPCPNGGEFNEQRAACDVVTPAVDRCAEEKPCLNDGQCTVLSNSTFKCTCRSDWTGDRCETPINSCVQKPCGPNTECRILKTDDYDQDYVCVCPSKKGYGLSCQEVVPNPCLKGTEQFFPYAFSQHAYIQCDGDTAHFQPCGPLLYWNQEDKVCDRKRPPKLDLATLIKKYGGENEDDESTTTTTTTTTTPTTRITTEKSSEEEKIGAHFRYIPAKVPNRQQGLFGQNQQQTQTVQNQRTQSGVYNQRPQDSQSRSNQWSNQQWTSTPSQFQQENQQYSNQQWSNQAPTGNTQNDQRSGSRTQSWQNQQQFQDKSDEDTTTTTAKTIVTTPNSQGRNFQSWQTQPTNQWSNNNQGTQSQSWQTQPTNQWNNHNQGVQSQPWQNVGGQQSVFTTTQSPINVPSWQTQPNNQWNNNNQGAQSQSWQTQPTNQWNNNNQGGHSQSWQNVGNQQPVFTTTPSTINVPSWQTQPNNQWNNNNQGVQSQPWQNAGGQQPVFTTTQSPINVPSWQTQPNNQWNNNQGGHSQTWQNIGNQQPVFTTTPSTINAQPWQNQWNNNQGVQSQPWPNSRSVASQPMLTTTTTPSTVNASISEDQTQWQPETVTSSVETTTTTTTDQSWQMKSQNQWNTNANSPTIGFQPQQKMNARPLTQPWQKVQTFVTQQPILPLKTTTPQPNVLPNNQWNDNQMSRSMSLTQQREALPNQKSFDQTPTWSQNNVNTQSMMDQRQAPETTYWNNNRA